MRRPDRYLAFRADDFPPTAIARGAGLSYAAASFADGGTSLSMTEFSRIIQWDEERALIRVEAGIRLFDLFRFLAERRHFLPIQPGHGLITVGGCIAANVHGKWGGGDTTFASQVQSLRLFHPSHGIVELSDTELPDVFNLTCGGYGLTGVILDATLRVKPLNSSVCKVQFIEIDDLDGSAAKITEIATCSAFLYTWHDFSRRGNGHAVRIDFADEGGRARRPLVPNPKSPRRSFPFCAYSRLTISAFNYFYQEFQMRRRITVSDLASTIFPVHALQQYFRLFGPSGFHSYQVILPRQAYETFAGEVISRARMHGTPITLASSKVFSGTRSMLRFAGDGICLSLDCPRSSRSGAFLNDVDALTIEAKGWPNLIKDSRLPRSVVEACYPEFDRFRAGVRAWDPARVFQSELSRRLSI